MNNKDEQEYETFESQIRKILVEINTRLRDAGWSIEVDIKTGGIEVIRKDGCIHTYAVGLTERELLIVLSAMGLVLILKEQAK